MSTDKKPLSLVSLKAELDALRDYVSYLKSELERSGIIFRGVALVQKTSFFRVRMRLTFVGRGSRSLSPTSKSSKSLSSNEAAMEVMNTRRSATAIGWFLEGQEPPAKVEAAPAVSG